MQNYRFRDRDHSQALCQPLDEAEVHIDAVTRAGIAEIRAAKDKKHRVATSLAIPVRG